MRKLFLVTLILFFVLNYNSIASSHDMLEDLKNDPNIEIVEPPEITIKSIPIDKEHDQIFDDIILEFLNTNWLDSKDFPDGDSFTQKLKSVKLIRIDNINNDFDRYITFLTFNVKRYSKESAQYTEEYLGQIIYLDVKDRKLIDWFPFETIDLSNFLRREI